MFHFIEIDYVTISIIEVTNSIDTESTELTVKNRSIINQNICLLNQTDSVNIKFTSSEREFVSPDQHLRRST